MTHTQISKREAEARQRGFPRQRGLALALLAALLALPGILASRTALGQTSIFRSDAEMKELDANRVGFATGGPGGTYIRLGVDLANLLDDRRGHPPFRVVVSTSPGSISNLDDLLNLRSIDIALVQGDVLEVFRNNPDDYLRLSQKLRFIAPMYEEDVHVLTRGHLTSIKDLAGKRVNIGAPGSGTQITARNLFDKLQITALWDEKPTEQALGRLLAGEIDALIYVVGKPSGLFTGIGPDDVLAKDLTFVPIPHGLPGLEPYQPSQLTATDYPNLIASGQATETVAVPSVMAVVAWDPKRRPDRYGPVKRFVESFFSKFPELARAGYNNNWCQVDLAGSVAGWQRFEAAESWLQSHRGAETRLPCAKPRDCDERFRAAMQKEGTTISDMNAPSAKDLLENWKRKNPGAC